MRLPRVRFTVRRLMIAVAIAGVLLGLLAYAQRFQDRSPAYQRLATHHGFIEANPGYFKFDHRCPPDCYHERTRLYHRRLRLKYERAARYPWLPVEPDPPEPVPEPPPAGSRSPFDLDVRWDAIHRPSDGDAGKGAVAP